ncbi:hypothetical protein BDF20DRAFT_852111 [Mycotypha africana]|uniref:uncharacterized protein n=1 Tax=Mycotypha africana TaxID=64632 RepID=UPI002300A74E|nr:uncharacterized protein BDF20DRAFT_852111 [Mycotypha africana]KAI8987766.1 hypothetical protein BDF20DRAFT_852111 [Mycotypha africana]
MTDLPPPPQPKPANMPPMTDADKVRLGIAGGYSNGHAASPPPMIVGAPMGYPPMVGGMGPNLVFNFYQPYGMMPMMPPPPEAGEEEEKPKEEKCKVITVQANPTWRDPRMPVKKGQPLKSDPCVIM